MSILNHSIPSNGQPPLPPKSSATQDAPQNLSVAHSPQRAHALKQFQSNSSKKCSSSLAISNRDTPQSISTVSDTSLKGLKMPGTDFAQVAQSFLCSLLDSEKFVKVDDTMGGEFEQYVPSKPSIVLSVSVSSAVKLDSEQIELIARKMQKLTGFRNLKMENIIDPTLIAGFTISYGDDESNLIDLSVKGQLAALAARVESSERRIANNVQRWSSPSAVREFTS